MSEDAADFVLDLDFGPGGVPHAEPGGFEFASGPIPLKGRAELLLWSHFQIVIAVIVLPHEERIEESPVRCEWGK